MEKLRQKIRRIDRQSYPSYKQLKGTYEFEDFFLDINHVQGDPFAAPSRISIRVATEKVPNLPKDYITHTSRRLGIEDAILRKWSESIRQTGHNRGSGKSGQWRILRPGQEMLPRSATEINEKEIIIRCTVGLPAQGRRVLGRACLEMLFDELPYLVYEGVLEADTESWIQHAKSYEDQDVLRQQLVEKDWVAFIANGSRLPRASGISDHPMKEEDGAIAWEGPSELEATVELPHAGSVKGTAIKKGVTLICGGGYHGKSTLLQALSRGVYNHAPNDGRELCATRYDAVAIRAEDGRAIHQVNITPFISNLPNNKDTDRFSTENASGSTSQAANIIEALELGSQCLLIDEDTSATNFMMRDRRMQELVANKREPITPFVDRVRELYEKHDVSSILVVGGSGDYFDVADEVIVMDTYRPTVQTTRVKEIAKKYPTERIREENRAIPEKTSRTPDPKSFRPQKGKRSEWVRTKETRGILFGQEEIDISYLHQLTDEGQARCIADWLIQLSRNLSSEPNSTNENTAPTFTLKEICDQIEAAALKSPLEKTLPAGYGDRVFARRFELGAAINRLRSLLIV